MSSDSRGDTGRQKELNTAWADPSPSAIADLIEHSRQMGWRAALELVKEHSPMFHRRMANLGLGDWHLLFPRPRQATVVDIGTGFGSLILGLGRYFRSAIGVEFLADRAAYAQIRASQEGSHNTAIMRGNGLHLPIKDGVAGLASMNGVLEWSGLYEQEATPSDLQERMLREARRILQGDGTLLVAIENRFALETILAMPDTHTGLHWVPIFPRPVANLISILRKRQRYRVWLHSLKGYRTLARRAGFPMVRGFDLISSYNDYDFIVDSSDALSYSFLYRHRLVVPFHQMAGRARRMLARVSSRWLGALNYAYLLAMGNSVTSVLDADHPIWQTAQRWGLSPGSARFACTTRTGGAIIIVAHDRGQFLCALRLDGLSEAKAGLDSRSTALQEALSRGRLVGSDDFCGRLLTGFDLRSWQS